MYSLKDFNQTSEMIFAKIDCLKEVLEAQRVSVKTYVERTKVLETENRNLRQQLEDIQARVEKIKQMPWLIV